MVPLASVLSDAAGSSALVQLLLATLLGGLVGVEREFHGRPAGLRTHILVCMASTMAMVVATRLPGQIQLGRVAAGALTGIGFIGAGAIIRLRGTNRGITTAACIWFVAAIGVVLGVGAYAVAVAGTALALGVLMGLHQLERYILAVSYRELVVLADLQDGMFERVRQVVEEELGLRAQAGEFEEDLAAGHIRVTFSVRYRGREMSEVLARRLRQLPGVRSITWRLAGS